jgi:hypothetical protein
MKEQRLWNLLIETGSRVERNTRIAEVRDIRASMLDQITFETSSVLVRLAGGETLSVPALKPAHELLSKAKYFFGGLEGCPCVYLEGRATVGGKEGSFLLNLSGAHFRPNPAVPAETVAAVRFPRLPR